MSEAYRVLSVDLMEPKVKQYVEMKMKKILTPSQAKSLAAEKKGWALRTLDQVGNAFILCFNGIEVALFYKRASTPMTVEEIDPIPEGPGIHQDKLWIRVEFFHTKAASSRNQAQIKYEQQMEEDLAKYKGMSSQYATELEQIRLKLEGMEGRLKRMAALRDKVTTIPIAQKKKKVKR